MKNVVEDEIFKKLILRNEKMFNDNEKKYIIENSRIFVKIYLLGLIDSAIIQNDEE